MGLEPYFSGAYPFMSKSFTLSVGIILALSVLFLFTYIFIVSPEKVAYVDSAKLLNSYKGMQNVRGAFEKKAALWKANVDTLAADVQTRIMRFEKEAGAMSAKERQLAQELIRAKQNQLQQYQQAVQTQAQQEESKVTSEVVSTINAYLKKYGESHHYKIIFALTAYGNIAYAQEGMDITEDVLQGLNNEFVK